MPSASRVLPVINSTGSCLNPGNSTKNGNLSINVSIATDDDHYAEGTVITVTCEDGYRVSDGGVSTCQLDGTWSSSSEIPSCTSEYI